MSYVTPWTGELEEGLYTITFPLVVTVGTDTYNFVQWEDGSTNPTRTVALNQNLSLTATYALPPTHELTVTSTPITGVPVTVDGTGYSTPTPPITLQEGTHTVECPANVQSGSDTYNFQQWEDGSVNTMRTVTLTSDTTIMASYVLVAPPPEKAYITVYAFLDSAEIVADGLIVDTNQPFQTRATLEVAPGTYTLRVTYSGQTLEKSATVEADQTVRVDFQFTPTPPFQPVEMWKVAAAGLSILTIIGIMALG